MWLVNAALRRPYTVWVGMLLVLILGIVSYLKTPTDILPNLKVPVVVVFASYRGMPAPDMEKSVTSVLERALTKCDHLEHIESRSLLGIGIVWLYFRPTVDPDVASSQVNSIVNSEMKNLPPGMLQPDVFKYDASSIPVGNLIIASPRRDEKYLLDLADHQLRDELAGIDGLASAPVFGGVFRQVQIYVDPRALESLKLSPMEVARRVNNQSQVLPTGEIRLGSQNYYVTSNAMAETPKEFEQIPIATMGRKTVFLGDVAEVLDSTRWRTNTVHVDGRPAVYMPLLRQAGASAVKVVDNVKDFLPKLKERGTVPEDVQIEVVFDQSQYVRDALHNLEFEALAGATLAALVVLLFLGSMRSTWIVALSIPLSVLAAFVGLYLSGHTLNIMTLGGLALVLGRIVDDSIVDVENTVRHLNLGKSPLDAARESAHEIAVPVLIATITTVVVFFPLIFIEGVGKYLFTPLAISAALAMFASYIVSRTVSPLFCSRFLRPHAEAEPFPWRFFKLAAIMTGVAGVLALGGWLLAPVLQDFNVLFQGTFLTFLYRALIAVAICGAVLLVMSPVLAGLFWVAPRFDGWFQQFTVSYERLLRKCLDRRLAVVGVLGVILLPSVWVFFHLGQELFPEVDASEFTVHLRATGGPRVEETERQVSQIEKIVREEVPDEDVALILSNIGISSRWSAIYTSNNGPHAAFVRVQLRSGFDRRRTPTSQYVDRVRTRLAAQFPANDFFYETSGMIRRILNNGAMAPLEVQVVGRDNRARRAVARALDTQIGRLPQVRDTYMPQGMDLPQLNIKVDRTRASLMGFSERDVITNVVTALMSSAQLAPNFWIDPESGNPYLIGVQYKEALVRNLQTLEDVPITSEGWRSGVSGREKVTTLKDVADVERRQGAVEVYHYNASRVSQIMVATSDNDLASVARRVDRIVHRPGLEFALNHLPDDKLELAEDEDFKQTLTNYLRLNRKSARESQRKQINAKYGVDPEWLRMPKGVHVEVRGEIASMRQSFKDMTFMLFLAVILVYLIMAAQFQSWLDPLIMITAAPLGLIGVVFMLWITGTSLNIQSFMGVLMMVGISVSNSVLLVEFANRQLETGITPLEAVVNAARVRMRPILMTTLATIAGLLPMAVHLRPGDEMNLPLARAVIGGLAGSTILTLFVVPVLYVLLKRAGRGAVARENS
jgi:multidrug efflux pump subunit AcrB